MKSQNNVPRETKYIQQIKNMFHVKHINLAKLKNVPRETH